MGKKYKNPPIIEALCEFRFIPGTEWDLAVPGLIYKEVRDQFPKRRQGRQMDILFKASEKGFQQEVHPMDRVQFLNETGDTMIQVSPNLITVNKLKYSSWHDFFPLIKMGLDSYVRVVSPKGLRRIGLRYINRIEIFSERVELGHYFHIRPFLGPELPQKHGAFITGVQLPFHDGRDILRLQIATGEAERSGLLSFILDLDYYSSQETPITENLFQWIINAHGNIETIFEACITDTLRSLFDEVKN